MGWTYAGYVYEQGIVDVPTHCIEETDHSENALVGSVESISQTAQLRYNTTYAVSHRVREL